MGTFESAPWDVYREIHKAMRFALSGVTTMAGATDAGNDDQLQRLLGEWSDVSFVLAGHHGHEDEFCDPLVERHTPGLRAELEAAHRWSEDAIEQLHTLAASLRTSATGTPARWELLRQFHLDLADFAAEYISHLRFEEDKVMPALNAAMTNDELAEVTMSIRMSVPPPDMCIFIRYMAPAMNFSERLDMLGGMHAGAPPEIFELFRAAAQDCLPPDDYEAIAVAGGFA
ncbi:MAG: hemerythrin domain-containing protein [Acidimicrobiia bacterium]